MARTSQDRSLMSHANHTFAIGASLVFGLAALAVISQLGGSIAISLSGITATVNSPQ